VLTRGQKKEKGKELGKSQKHFEQEKTGAFDFF
jgi:hypothetical protein